MDSTPALPWYRVPTMWLVLALPLTAVVVGFIMLGLAIWSHDGMAVDDYHRRSKEINLDLARDRLAAAQGRHASLRLIERELRVDLRSSAASPPARIDVQLLHATRPGNDRRLLLERGTDGRYRAVLGELRAGRYNVQLAGDGWRLLGSLTVPGDNRVELSAQSD